MLYIVATPIGNLGDMTYRAVETLKSVDRIICEDTRHSLTLLNHYEIKKPLTAFHKFNTAKTLPEIVERLKNGENIALISDAGMPCVCDPGAELVRAAMAEGIDYTVIPGACAFIAAAVLAGSSDGGFAFAGFLPDSKKDRTALLESYRFMPCPLAFYVSPHSIESDIASIYEVYGDRKISVVREITKLHETVEHSTLKEGLKTLPRGEYVLIVEGCEKRSDLNSLSVEEHLKYYTDLGVEKKEAIKQVARDRGVNKNEIYKKFV